MTADSIKHPSRIDSLLASRRTHIALTAVLSFLCIAFAASLLFSAFSALTWFKFALFDYGIYTNMIWNSGRGRMFLVLTTRSYLKTHLSFTLAMLGPLYYVWDHPFLLSVVQWLMLIGGAAGIALAGIRHKLAKCLAMSIALLYIAYPLSQSVMLCEFHGVAAYLALIPWLYYCLSFRRNLAWVPLILLLGLREDAFLVALPILAYFTVRHRSPLVAAMFTVSLVYGLVALFYIYPAVAGKSLLDRRAGCLPDGPLFLMLGTPDVVLAKLRALAWVALPAALFVRRGWPSILTFLSAPILITLASAFRSQYELRLHYPAAVMACLGIALIEASRGSNHTVAPPYAARPAAVAAILMLITLGAHAYRGYLPLGGKFKTVYARPNPDGLATMRAVRKIPRDGILMAPDRLMPFCANRRAITKWTYLAKPERPRDLIFAGLIDLFGRRKSTFRSLLASGDFGLQYVDNSNVLLVKGGDTAANAKMLAALDASDHTIRFHTTLRHGGDNVSTSEGAILRHWPAEVQSGPVTIAYGQSVKLPPGEYEATFRFKTGKPGSTLGVLSLHPLNKPDAIVQESIALSPNKGTEFSTQRLRFSLTEWTRVEPRATAGKTELWLNKVDFVRIEQDRR